MSTPATTPAPPQDLQKQITAADLSTANGNDSKNLWVGLYVATLDKICVFDVSSRPDFYGPGSGYHVFTGRDASRALATMQLKEEKSNIDDLTEIQVKTLADWAKKYLEKYPIVGVLSP